MNSFLYSYKKTMKNEGGYSNHPADRGGETYKGISRNYHPEWKGWKIIDNEITFKDSKNLENLVQTFYKKNYWDPLRLDEIDSQRIQSELFDISVNFGKRVAAKTLQRALNILNRDQKKINDLKVDGWIGKITLSVIDIYLEDYLVKVIILLKAKYYIDIVEKTTSQETFIRGWLNRINL